MVIVGRLVVDGCQTGRFAQDLTNSSANLLLKHCVMFTSRLYTPAELMKIAHAMPLKYRVVYDYASPLYLSLNSERPCWNLTHAARCVYVIIRRRIAISLSPCVCVGVWVCMLARSNENPWSEWLETWHSTRQFIKQSPLILVGFTGTGPLTYTYLRTIAAEPTMRAFTIADIYDV